MSATDESAARAATLRAPPAAARFVPGAPAKLFGSLAIDAAFNVEQSIDAFDGLQRDRRDRRRILPAPGVGRDIRKFEELPASVCPTQGGGNR
jgi:hypothetical protein